MRLNTKINEEASGRGLFLSTVFLVVGFYKKDENEMSICLVFQK